MWIHLDSRSAQVQERIDEGMGLGAVSGSYGINMKVGVYTIMPSIRFYTIMPLTVCSVIAMLISD